MSIEKKYAFDNRLSKTALSLASRLFRPDSEHEFSIVSSIYYDTIFEDFVAEKSDSDYLKQKIRLRWYEGLDCQDSTPRYFLELKQKCGIHRAKSRHDITEQLEFLSCEVRGGNRDTRQTLIVNRLLREFHGDLIPKVFPRLCISYERHRFHTPFSNERINLDCNINVSRAGARQPPASIPGNFRQAVLEVKGSGYSAEGPVTSLLKTLDARKAAFSKYLVGYEMLYD